MIAPREGSFSPGELQPGPFSTTGARSPASNDGFGNQWATIGVPSKDLTTRSSACAVPPRAAQATTLRAIAPLTRIGEAT